MQILAAAEKALLVVGWKLKLAWYGENGILAHDEGGGPNGTLITSSETEGFDYQQDRAIGKIIKSGG